VIRITLTVPSVINSNARRYFLNTAHPRRYLYVNEPNYEHIYRKSSLGKLFYSLLSKRYNSSRRVNMLKYRGSRVRRRRGRGWRIVTGCDKWHVAIGHMVSYSRAVVVYFGRVLSTGLRTIANKYSTGKGGTEETSLKKRTCSAKLSFISVPLSLSLSFSLCCRYPTADPTAATDAAEYLVRVSLRAAEECSVYTYRDHSAITQHQAENVKIREI
jgi:hypothetical protein